MPCKQTKTLIETAAQGTESPIAEREHLAACPDCRAAYTQHKDLLAAIDSHLYQSVNTEIPASFLSRAQARIAGELPVRNTWSPAWAVVAALALFVVSSVVAWNAWNGVSGKKNTVVMDIVPPVTGHAPLNAMRASSPPKKRAVRATHDSLQNLDFRPLVAANQQAIVDQLIKGIRRGEIDGTVLVSSARQDLEIPDIVIAPIAAPAPDQTLSEPDGSSKISVPEPARDSK